MGKKILLIPVGGTICTELNSDGNLSVSRKAGPELIANFRASDSPYAESAEIALAENLYILSENMTVDKWNRMIEAYLKYSSNENYDGIIFAHGTDTLAFSAALFSQLLCGTEIPVFFVSANKRLCVPSSNGNENFRCAVECIERGITPNVYAVYKNISDGRMYLHLGSRLRQCENYSDDFKSFGAIDITDINEANYADCFEQIAKLYPKNDRIPLITPRARLKPCVLMLDPYVGIDYSVYDYKKFRAVLHGSYHSGTACAEGENSVLYMIDRCAENGVDTYFSPAILKRGTYETVSIIGEYEAKGKSINFLYGYTKECAYAKLLIAYSLIDSAQDREQFLKTECNFELVRGE